MIDNNSKIYKELWKNYNLTPCVYSSLHLMLVKIMYYYAKKSEINKSLFPKNIISLVKEIYDNIIIKDITPYMFNSKIYGDNKLIKTQIDIITHIVKTNIMTDLSNILYVVLVMDLKTKPDQTINHDIITNLYSMLVNDDLCLKITKYVLKIYDSNDDILKGEKKMDFIFDKINNYLRNNMVKNYVVVDNLDKINKLINDTIKPYYLDLLVQVIENLKLVLDNYCVFIINDHKYLEILNILINA